MNDLLPHAEDLLINRRVFGLAMLLALALVIATSRFFLRDVLTDSSSGWRRIAQIWLIATCGFALWTSLFDDWLQLVGEPFRRSRQWASERIIANPIAPELRTVTLVLLALAVLLSAAIVARHIGGYGLQISTLIIAAILWIPLFVLRQRLDILVHDGVSDRSGNAADFAGLALFWLLRTGLSIAVTAISFAILVLLVAPLMTLVLDLFRVRTPRTTEDAEDFFTALHQQAGVYEDVPLRARWRPIQRPS